MTDNHTSEEKIVSLVDKVMEGQPPVTELDRKRAVMFRAFELTAGQLEHDATELCAKAVLTPAENLPMDKREHMIHTGFMLRETAAWIRTMLLPPKQEPTNG